MPLFEQLCYNGVTLTETLEQIRPSQLETERAQMMTQATRAIQTSTRGKNCGRTGHWAKDCWRPGGGAYDNSTSNNSCTQKGKNHKKKETAKANKWTLWKRISPLKQPQPCSILQKHRVRSELSRAIQTGNRKVGSWV